MILQTAHIRPLSRSNPEVQLLIDDSLDETRRENLSAYRRAKNRPRDPRSEFRPWELGWKIAGKQSGSNGDTGLMVQKSGKLTCWYGKYPMIHRVSYMLGGAGFLPSTVFKGSRNLKALSCSDASCQKLWLDFCHCFFCHFACSNAQVSCQNQTNFDPYRTWWLEEKGTVSELRKVPLEVQDLSGSYLEPQNPQNHKATYTYVDIHTYIMYIFYI